MKHTFDSAAKAICFGFSDQIARTWKQYDIQQAKRGSWLNAYTAALLVCEQVLGVNWRAADPGAFQKASHALETAIPELFADYWMELPTTYADENISPPLFRACEATDSRAVRWGGGFNLTKK
jgi:hypothetical protein